MSPSELGQKAATMLFQAGAPLPSAIVFAEVAKIAPDDPAVWCGLGSAVARCAGVLVVAPFVRWGTRCFERSLVLSGEGAFADVSREWLAELRQRPEYEPLPAMSPRELDELLQFLDLNADVVVEGVDQVPPDDQMFVVMAIGDLGSPRFVPVIAAAVSGRWGGGAARSALKRVGPVAGAPEVRAALASLRAGPLGAECDPYLRWVENQPVPAPPIAVVRGKETATTAGPDSKPWWKLW